jgi:hypothetical protein
MGMATLGAAALAGCLIGAPTAEDSEIVGTWNCAGSAADPAIGMTMNVEYVQTYSADKAYERTADLTIRIEAFQLDLAMTVTDSGSWRREAMAVTELMSDIQFSSANETPSPEEQATLQTIQAEAEADIGTEETMQIRSLTASTMELEDDEDMQLTCSRA